MVSIQLKTIGVAPEHGCTGGRWIPDTALRWRLQHVLINRERFWLVGHGDLCPTRVVRGHDSEGTAIGFCAGCGAME